MNRKDKVELNNTKLKFKKKSKANIEEQMFMSQFLFILNLFNFFFCSFANYLFSLDKKKIIQNWTMPDLVFCALFGMTGYAYPAKKNWLVIRVKPCMKAHPYFMATKIKCRQKLPYHSISISKLDLWNYFHSVWPILIKFSIAFIVLFSTKKKHFRFRSDYPRSSTFCSRLAKKNKNADNTAQFIKPSKIWSF